jgi:hypothetical protein
VAGGEKKKTVIQSTGRTSESWNNKKVIKILFFLGRSKLFTLAKDSP